MMSHLWGELFTGSLVQCGATCIDRIEASVIQLPRRTKSDIEGFQYPRRLS